MEQPLGTTWGSVSCSTTPRLKEESNPDLPKTTCSTSWATFITRTVSVLCERTFWPDTQLQQDKLTAKDKTRSNLSCCCEWWCTSPVATVQGFGYWETCCLKRYRSVTSPVTKFHNLTASKQKTQRPKDKWFSVLGSWTQHLLCHISPNPKHWLEFMSPVLHLWLLLPLQLLQQGQLLLSSAPHLCFVCIIKETRSKLMERYKPKLLRRKWETMSNLRSLLVSHHSVANHPGLSLSFTSVCPTAQGRNVCENMLAYIDYIENLIYYHCKSY